MATFKVRAVFGAWGDGAESGGAAVGVRSSLGRCPYIRIDVWGTRHLRFEILPRHTIDRKPDTRCRFDSAWWGANRLPISYRRMSLFRYGQMISRVEALPDLGVGTWDTCLLLRQDFLIAARFAVAQPGLVVWRLRPRASAPSGTSSVMQLPAPI